MVRVRFAPSPTGNIHIGNVRAALFNYVFSKKHNGQMILRLEDTDLERSSEESAEGIIEDLAWLGITFHEGPHIGGDSGPYRQMERLDLYKKYAEELLASGKAEKDFSHLDDPSDTANQSYAIRFKAGGQKIRFRDLVFGEVEKEVEDFIIMKSNGIPTYHFGVVVDDHLMNITHVIRGQDHLGNTAKHVMLFEALGFEPPIYAHYSLTHGLSKRDASKSIKSLREKGYLPEAIINIAMLLGWAPKDGIEKFNIFDKLEEFDPGDFGRVNANFDEEKFNWLAGQYIREADLDRLLTLSRPYLEEAGFISATNPSDDYIKSVLDIVRGNVKCVSELVDYVDFFFRDISYESDKARAMLDTDDSRTVLKSFLDKLNSKPQITADDFKSYLKEIQSETGIKGKNLFMPVRIALTGRLHGPEMFLVAPVLGHKLCASRLESSIQ
ncbi:MAG: glutamate--tRNA ligase [Spirochaetota bacterium]|nr:glutamate--tRNA ligase [Spirochaetota bacterium]